MALVKSVCRPNHWKNSSPVLVILSQLLHSHNGQANNPARKSYAQATQEADRENKRWLTYNHTSKPTPESVRERNITVSSYYNQTAIDEASQQNSIRLTPNTIMYSSGTRTDVAKNVMKSAQYLRRYKNDGGNQPTFDLANICHSY